ncbi:MAG TPA: hypothetical protein VLA49_07405 [Anaerolineales bacterium]|nr:hypothetical protein [Anaerolineales bacterium]
MFRKKLLFVFVLVLALSLLASAVSADGLSSASGFGYFYLPDGTYWSQTFTAVEHADGSVTGQAHAIAHADPIRIGHVTLDCLRVHEDPLLGHVAFMSGWVTLAINPSYPIPAYATFYVVDGGEGSGTVEYISTPYVASDPGVFNCDMAYSAGVSSFPGYRFPVVKGNIQVRP